MRPDPVRTSYWIVPFEVFSLAMSACMSVVVTPDLFTAESSMNAVMAVYSLPPAW